MNVKRVNMKSLKFLHISRKGITEIFRDKRGLVILVFFPVLYILLFAFAFGSGSFLSGGSIPHEVVVVNNDAGVMVAGTNNTTRYVNYGSNFTQVLTNTTAENSSTHLFHLSNASQGEAENLLKSRSIDALIVIPQNFSAGLASEVNNSTRTAITSSVGQQAIANAANSSTALNPVTTTPGASVTLPAAGNVSSALTIEGDSGYMNFATTQATASQLFDQYKNSSTDASHGGGQIRDDAKPIPGFRSYGGTVHSRHANVLTVRLHGAGTHRLRIDAAGDCRCGILGSRGRNGDVGSVKAVKGTSFDLLLGTMTIWSLITILQVLLLIAVAIALGYHHQGDFSSLGLAVLIGVIAGMASISLALIVASFTTNEMQAILLSGMISVPLGFLAGAFIQPPRRVLGEFGGRTYQLYDLLPWTHAISALRAVLTYGSGLSADVIFEMSWLIVLAAILFVIGVLTYALVRLKAEK